MENKESYMVDVLSLVEQTVDKSIDNMVLQSLAESEYQTAVYKLLNEYGLSGRKALEFMYKLDALSKMFGETNNKEEEPECN